MSALGTLYAEGWGVTRDRSAAKLWYEKAAALGDTGAMQKIATLFEKGTGKAGAKR
ncbi:hypothetical protein [Methylorubrum extorquens]